MGFWVIFVIIVAAFFIVEPSFESIFFGSLMAFIVGGLIFAFICAVIPAETAYNDTEYDLHALVDNVSYEGTVYNGVFVIRGTINNTLKYQYMYYENEYGWTTKEVNADDSYLNFNAESPKVVARTTIYANPTLEYWFPYPSDTDYIFYLPDSADVIDSFIVDFQ